MCGFYFYFNKNGKKLSSKQISNLKVIQHDRGPDHSGFLYNNDSSNPLNKWIRFSKEVMLLSSARKPYK